FKPAVVEDAFLLIDLKAHAPIDLDVCAQVTSRTGRVEVNFPVRPKIEQGDAIGEAVLAHGRNAAAIPVCKHLRRAFCRHDSVGTDTDSAFSAFLVEGDISSASLFRWMTIRNRCHAQRSTLAQ